IVAVKLLQRLCLLLGTRSAPTLEDYPALAPIAEAPGVSGPGGEGAASPLDALKAVLQEQMLEQIHNGNFFTNDRVEVRGRLGTEDNREMKINGIPPLNLEKR